MDYEFSGVRVTFNEQSKLFFVIWADDEQKSYDSWAQATAAIAARLDRQEKSNKVKLSVPVRDTAGNKYVITGIHGGHGGYLGKPSIPKYGDALYLDHPVVESITSRLLAAEAAVKQAENDLLPFKLSDSDCARRRDHLDTSEGIKAWEEKTSRLADEALGKQQAASQKE